MHFKQGGVSPGWQGRVLQIPSGPDDGSWHCSPTLLQIDCAAPPSPRETPLQPGGVASRQSRTTKRRLEAKVFIAGRLPLFRGAGKSGGRFAPTAPRRSIPDEEPLHAHVEPLEDPADRARLDLL